MGNDTISSVDRKGGDSVKCGAGKDIVSADKGDKVGKDCETVKRK